MKRDYKELFFIQKKYQTEVEDRNRLLIIEKRNAEQQVFALRMRNEMLLEIIKKIRVGPRNLFRNKHHASSLRS